MKNKQTQALILGILFMLVAIGGLILHKPKEERKVTFTPVTTAEETSESATSATKTTTVTTVTSSATTVRASATETTSETVTEFLLLDLNKASAEEFAKLKGIGETKAAAIISYREEHGGFGYIEEIMMVEGIGSEIFDDIKPHIYVENPVTTAAATETVTETEAQPETVTTAEVTAAETETEHMLTLEDVAPVNINTAGIEELTLLPNIDEKTAEGIIELRDKIHGYENVYELLYVDGISQKELSELLEFVTIGQ